MKRIDQRRIFELPRFLLKQYFIHWNRLKFKVCGIKLGRNSHIFNKVYIDKEIGAQVIIGDNFTLSSGANFNPLCRNLRASICLDRSTSVIEIGDDTGLSSPCIWAKERISIGNRVNVGGDCVLMDSDAHNLDYRIRGSKEQIHKVSIDALTAKTAPIIIEDDVLIGTRCIVLKGVTIGARSIIGSGSIVTKSIPSDCIAAGNPCRVIRSINQD